MNSRQTQVLCTSAGDLLKGLFLFFCLEIFTFLFLFFWLTGLTFPLDSDTRAFIPGRSVVALLFVYLDRVLPWLVLFIVAVLCPCSLFYLQCNAVPLLCIDSVYQGLSLLCSVSTTVCRMKSSYTPIPLSPKELPVCSLDQAGGAVNDSSPRRSQWQLAVEYTQY